MMQRLGLPHFEKKIGIGLVSSLILGFLLSFRPIKER
jgi:hypothetical protein